MKAVALVYPDAPPGRADRDVVEGSESEDVTLVESCVKALQAHHQRAPEGRRPGEGDPAASFTERAHKVVCELDTHLAPRVMSNPIIPPA